MKNTKYLFFVFLLNLCSCDELNEEGAKRGASFIVSLMNGTDQECGTASLNFTFLITVEVSNVQESYTIAPGMKESTGFFFNNEDVMNIKIFSPSDDLISEANIPFQYNNISDEDLETPNVLNVEYCHNLTNGIRWVFDY